MDEWKSLDLFKREAQALRRLDHPGIPGFVDDFALPDGTSLVLVQRLVQGRSLQACIDDGERFDPGQIEAMLRGLLDILAYLHSLSPPVVHRDLKPGNVIVRPDGGVSLVDFGAITERLRPDTVGGSTTVGTVGYMPMEQMVGKAVPASDLYALGMTILAAVTGVGPEELPYDDTSGRVDVFAATPGLPGGPRGLLHELTAPGVGLRPESAAAALVLLDTPTGMAAPADIGEFDGGWGEQPADLSPVRSGYATHKKLWRGLMALGGVIAVGMYGPLFDLLSEEMLFLTWGVWGYPAAFGIIGHWLERESPSEPNMVRKAGIAAAVVVALFSAGILGAVGG